MALVYALDLEVDSLDRLVVIVSKDSCMNFICCVNRMDAFTLLVRLLPDGLTRLKGIFSN